MWWVGGGYGTRRRGPEEIPEITVEMPDASEQLSWRCTVELGGLLEGLGGLLEGLGDISWRASVPANGSPLFPHVFD